MDGSKERIFTAIEILGGENDIPSVIVAGLISRAQPRRGI